MPYAEDDYLQISGIQHFAFCRRQWALIHVESQWAENYRTTDGHLLHERAHDPAASESRGELLILRGLRIFSPTLGVSGECDVVELRADEKGVSLPGREGRWQPCPVEYKRGRPNAYGADELQLCAQALCLEEMLCCSIPRGALFYGEPHRRTPVDFTPELRERVKAVFAEMHGYMDRGYTPKVRTQKGCAACSLRELCLPKLMKKKSPGEYLEEALREL